MVRVPDAAAQATTQRGGGCCSPTALDDTERASLPGACDGGRSPGRVVAPSSQPAVAEHAYASPDNRADITFRLRALARHIASMDSGSEDAALLMDAAHEIGRLRAIIRVNVIRSAPSVSYEQISEVIYGR